MWKLKCWPLTWIQGILQKYCCSRISAIFLQGLAFPEAQKQQDNWLTGSLYIPVKPVPLFFHYIYGIDSIHWICIWYLLAGALNMRSKEMLMQKKDVLMFLWMLFNSKGILLLVLNYYLPYTAVNKAVCKTLKRHENMALICLIIAVIWLYVTV